MIQYVDNLNVNYHHNESLEQVQACTDGDVDITLLSISYETQRAPLYEIIDMPLIGFDEYAANRAWFELQEIIPEFGAEFGEFKELLHLVALPVVFNLNKEARTPEDFKGMKIQAAGMVSDMLKAAGADPIIESPVE